MHFPEIFSRWTSSYTAVSRGDSNTAHAADSVEKSEVLDEEGPSRLLRFPWLTLAQRDVIYLVAAICTFVLLMFAGIYGARPADGSTQAQQPARLCGSSAAEATSLGCTWDQLTWAWYPPGCRHYANDEFLAYHDWKFWVDPFGSLEVVGENWTLALSNKKEIWTQRGEHLTHCVFFFLGMAQGIRDAATLPSRFTEYKHIEHCANFLLDALRQDKDWERIDTSPSEAFYDVHC
ncbi:hypothetical protein QBC47DRAFT_401572 [Echria macrotheca]|uniref:Uncharacterized protein n=1 Tax=Echria macrotheca TaxID=438768 RepID=A0AAJ0BE25_9PEZI|nr:hypothetical protein QBC47DRAFT_401572 [Echria macrotheca]